MDTVTAERRGWIAHNGRMHTVDAAMPEASVLGLLAGRIVYAGGSLREAKALLPGARLLDLRGHAVIPGLIDSHQHFIMQGQSLAELVLQGLSREDVLAAVAARARAVKPGEWIVGRGWNHELWPGREWPRREELDAAAPDNPVALTRMDGHSMWANTRALAVAGIDRNTPDPSGGEILRTPDGALRGILVDTPLFMVRAAIPPLTESQKREACLAAQAAMFRHGITSVGDAWQTPEDHAFLRELYASGALRIRIYGMLASRFREGLPVAGVDSDPVRGLYGGRLSLAAFKVVLDGSLGSRSAWLTADYADRPGHKGNSRYSDDALYAALHAAGERGFQLCVHAIGDAAVLQALRAFERLRGDATRPANHPANHLASGPHRIEHFQIASPETIARALALGVIPSMQTLHALADKSMAEARLAPAMLAHAYPWRAVLDRGGIIANGSDSPMDGENPFHGFFAAIGRTPFSSGKSGEGNPAMTREEALKSYTLWGAMAELAARDKGSLTPGKFADFAVLDRDILTCPAEEVRDARALLTVVGGEAVYAAPGGAFDGAERAFPPQG